jgi:hypothetical protein
MLGFSGGTAVAGSQEPLSMQQALCQLLPPGCQQLRLVPQ